MKLTKIFTMVAFVALPLATYGSGCSGSTKTTGDAGSGGSGSGSGSSSSSGATGSSSSGGSSSGSSGSDAAAACTPVCGTQCAKETCATPPANTTTGDACDTCITMAINGACNTALVAACSGDQDCLALFGQGGCLDGCDTKADGGTPTDVAAADQACFGSDGGAVGCQTCCLSAHMHGQTTIDTALLGCVCCK